MSYYESKENKPDLRKKVPRRKKGWIRFLVVVLMSALVGGGAGIGGAYVFLQRQPAQESQPQGQVTERVVKMDDHGNLSVTDIAEKAVPAVVGVTNYGQSSGWFSNGEIQPVGNGSGVIIEKNGTIVTNFHVIADAKAIKVTLNDGKEYKAKVIGFDEKTDLAVLKIDVEGLRAIEIGKSSDVRVGDLAVAVGNPLGQEFSQTVTDGIVSGINRKLQGEGQAFNLLQTNCAINAGNSGGALLDGQGRLIGINSAKIAATGVEGIGFAIPIDDVMTIVQEIQKNGHVERPYLGITGYSLTPELSAQLRLSGHEQGVLVAQVVEDSPAAQAGVKGNDLILKAEGKEIASFESLSEVLKGKKPGDEISLTVLRNGESLDLKVTLGSQNGVVQ